MPETKLNNRQLPNVFSSKTIDSTNDINTTLARLKISGGSNGQVLSTDGSGTLSWISVAGGDIDCGMSVLKSTFINDVGCTSQQVFRFVRLCRVCILLPIHSDSPFDRLILFLHR